jgi:nicotinate-nucleotide adenylyltransferase
VRNGRLIGLLGGSFDPVHHGHLIVGRVALEQLGLDELRFVPAREQPFKQGKHRTSADHRAAMLGLAISGSAGFELETAELDRPGPSYTVPTLEAVREREPGSRLILLLGADAAADLAGWRDFERIPELATLVVFARPGSTVPRTRLISRVIQVPAIDVSATEIRWRVRQRLPIRYWVPDSVAEYITRHRLYLDPE